MVRCGVKITQQCLHGISRYGLPDRDRRVRVTLVPFPAVRKYSDRYTTVTVTGDYPDSSTHYFQGSSAKTGTIWHVD